MLIIIGLAIGIFTFLTGKTLYAEFETFENAAFIFGSHLAFTMAYDESYVFAVIFGKLISGIFAVTLALMICNKNDKKRENKIENTQKG